MVVRARITNISEGLLEHEYAPVRRGLDQKTKDKFNDTAIQCDGLRDLRIRTDFQGLQKIFQHSEQNPLHF